MRLRPAARHGSRVAAGDDTLGKEQPLHSRSNDPLPVGSSHVTAAWRATLTPHRHKALMRSIARLATAGHRIIITHGNGPVVGNIVLRGEAARDQVPPMPLYIADADSEGGVGLMLQQALHNELARIGVVRPIATLVTPQAPSQSARRSRSVVNALNTCTGEGLRSGGTAT